MIIFVELNLPFIILIDYFWIYRSRNDCSFKKLVIESFFKDE